MPDDAVRSRSEAAWVVLAAVLAAVLLPGCYATRVEESDAGSDARADAESDGRADPGPSEDAGMEAATGEVPDDDEGGSTRPEGDADLGAADGEVDGETPDASTDGRIRQTLCSDFREGSCTIHSGAGCPVTMPDVGESCTEVMRCNYGWGGHCDPGGWTSASCGGGHWSTASMHCDPPMP
ncbi:MAG: hypothetical protein HY905_21525 [Deltaproteobacteria bacterium]|nr:hypothetical protein [Deltaproteobacteria bacterium]